MVGLAFTKVLTYPLPGQPFNDEFTACDDRTFTTGDKRILIGELFRVGSLSKAQQQMSHMIYKYFSY